MVKIDPTFLKILEFNLENAHFDMKGVQIDLISANTAQFDLENVEVDVKMVNIWVNERREMTGSRYRLGSRADRYRSR